jgi:hypothetical protein
MTPISHVPVPSPCKSTCRMDAERRFCTGCQRTLAEIAGWASMSDEAKSAVWAALPSRHAGAAAPRSGDGAA